MSVLDRAGPREWGRRLEMQMVHGARTGLWELG